MWKSAASLHFALSAGNLSEGLVCIQVMPLMPVQERKY